MKTKLIALLLALVFIFSLVGCAKCVSTEYEDVEVRIVDGYHRGSWMQPIFNGETTTYITHPAVGHITVEYEGVEYTVGGSDTYHRYIGKIGQTVTGVLEIRKFDDGTVTYDVVGLG